MDIYFQNINSCAATNNLIQMCIFSLYLTYSVYNLDLINTLICIQKIVIVMLSPMCGSTSQTNIAGVFPLSMHS